MTSSVVGPSGPRPGVERAIAEVLKAHRIETIKAQCRCGWAVVRYAQHEAHQAAAIVAAIPSLPDAELAELVGGEVEEGDTWFEASPNQWEPNRRVTTPWRSVTSPEENR